MYNNYMGNEIAEKKNVKKTGRRAVLLIFAITVLVLGVIIYLMPTVANVLTKTWVLKYDRIQVADDVTCYFIRSETLYKAIDNGNIQYYFDEGTLIRKGTKILDISPGSGNYIALENASLSYYSDDLEETFSPETMDKLNRKTVEGMKIEVQNLKRESALAGEPIYKLVKTAEWYVTFWVKAEAVAKYEKDHTIYLDLDLGRVKGITYDIIDDGDYFQIILKFSRHYGDLCKMRRVETKATTSDYEGLLAPNKSITAKDGQPGVYVKDLNGEFKFTPVSVITSDGVYSLLESSYFNVKKEDGTSERVATVKAYDEILSDPKRPE